MKLTIRPLQRGKDVFVVSSSTYLDLSVFLLNISGLQVEAEPSQTIHDLKLRISERGIPVEAQNLLKTGNLAFSRSDCTVVLR